MYEPMMEKAWPKISVNAHVVARFVKPPELMINQVFRRMMPGYMPLVTMDAPTILTPWAVSGKRIT